MTFPELAWATSAPERGTSAFHVRVFRTENGYLAWVDGLGTVEGRTLAETRRAALGFIRTVVGGAFPDRPSLEAAGAEKVLEFQVEVLERRPYGGFHRPRARGPHASRR